MFDWFNFSHTLVLSSYRPIVHYLVSDSDEQDEDYKNEQVANDADTSNDDVDDFECKVTDVGEIHRQIIGQ